MGSNHNFARSTRQSIRREVKFNLAICGSYYAPFVGTTQPCSGVKAEVESAVCEFTKDFGVHANPVFGESVESALRGEAYNT